MHKFILFTVIVCYLTALDYASTAPFPGCDGNGCPLIDYQFVNGKKTFRNKGTEESITITISGCYPASGVQQLTIAPGQSQNTGSPICGNIRAVVGDRDPVDLTLEDVHMSMNPMPIGTHCDLIVRLKEPSKVVNRIPVESTPDRQDSSFLTPLPNEVVFYPNQTEARAAILTRTVSPHVTSVKFTVHARRGDSGMSTTLKITQ